MIILAVVFPEADGAKVEFSARVQGLITTTRTAIGFLSLPGLRNVLECVHLVSPTTYDERPTTASRKLFQKSHIPLKEQLQIIQTVLQHCDSVYAHAEGEARNLFRIVTVVPYEIEDVGVHHATAEDLYPS